MPEVPGTGERVDAGHWVSSCGGSVMFVVAILCTVGLAAPWWTLNEEADSTLLIEVSLWTRYARMEAVTTSEALDCETSCDITNLGSSTVRETRDPWLTTCRDAQDDLASTCSSLWVIRVCLLVSWSFALLYSAVALLAFFGSGRPGAFRFPASCSILLSLGCLAALPIALIISGGLGITVTPPTPGSELRATSIPVKSVDMNGAGFVCTLISLFVSMLGLGFACLNQSVMDHLHKRWEFESGRPMADANRGVAPVHASVKPPPLKLNTWTLEP